MVQSRHLTTVDNIVKVEDAIDRKIFKAAYKITTPLATIASVFVLLFFVVIALLLIWGIVFLFTTLLRL